MDLLVISPSMTLGHWSHKSTTPRSIAPEIKWGMKEKVGDLLASLILKRQQLLLDWRNGKEPLIVPHFLISHSMNRPCFGISTKTESRFVGFRRNHFQNGLPWLVRAKGRWCWAECLGFEGAGQGKGTPSSFKRVSNKIKGERPQWDWAQWNIKNLLWFGLFRVVFFEMKL